MALLLKKGLDREGIVKTNLVQTLIDCVKELQLKYVAERSDCLTNDETTNVLCYCLEAVFIHGLKNPFLKSMSSVLNTSRENRIPEPSFWEFILIFIHQDIILQISRLNHIKTDIGRCRAWIRIVLNDSLLISYMHIIMADKRVLKEYYKPGAFLRDTERCDLVKSYLLGIEAYNFQLACNSSLLNSWNSTPLTLIGLWTPPDTTIAQGIDVVKNMETKDMQALPNLKQQSQSPPREYSHLQHDSAFGRAPLLEEDEALRLILSSKGSTRLLPLSSRSRSGGQVSSGNDPTSFTSVQNTASTTNPLHENPKVQDDDEQPTTSFMASTFPTSCTDSGNGSDEYVDTKERPVESNSVPIAIYDTVVTPQEEEEGSYAALFQSYSKSDSVIGTPIGLGSPITMGTFLQSSSFLPFDQKQAQTTISFSPSTNPNPVDNHRKSMSSECDFVIVSPVQNDDISSCQNETVESFDSLVMLAEKLQTIPNESGLDAQNYRCNECNRPIGMLYGAAKVCSFSGNYYCGECHLNDESVIPSRILMNWDFTRFTISLKARDFLNDIADKPILDLNKINPKLYTEIEECGEVLKLRTQLNSISRYLLTCKDPSMQEVLSKEFWMKEHIYHDIHTYAFSDLLNIPNRQLLTTLTRVVSLGSTHIKSCTICRLKGFICEICKESEVIFPFELESIFKCLTCGAVYHNQCMNNNVQCPRCDRWKSK